jgi:transcriptional antiterminator RfaH
MPILPREDDMFPETLLEAEPTPEQKWWALYTLARREKDLMRRLRGMSICFYAPLAARRSRSPAGRIRVSHVPLFPGYVFLCGGEDDRHAAFSTGCVSRSLPVADRHGLVQDLRQIWRLIESNAPLTPEARLQPGMPVRVRNGPLAGMEGVVIKRRGTDRLLVAVRFLQQGASVSLEDYQVESL